MFFWIEKRIGKILISIVRHLTFTEMTVSLSVPWRYRGLLEKNQRSYGALAITIDTALRWWSHTQLERLFAVCGGKWMPQWCCTTIMTTTIPADNRSRAQTRGPHNSDGAEINVESLHRSSALTQNLRSIAPSFNRNLRKNQRTKFSSFITTEECAVETTKKLLRSTRIFAIPCVTGQYTIEKDVW